MLTIDNLKFLSKVEGAFDNLKPPSTKLKVIIDDTFEYPYIEGTTKHNITVWENGILPAVELSPYQQAFSMQFLLYQESYLIGQAMTRIGYKENRQDCLDTLSEENYASGIISFQCYWADLKNGQYITFQQFCVAKENGTLKDKNLIFAKKLEQPKKKNQPPPQRDEDCGGFCGCFVSKKRKKNPARRQEPIQKVQLVQQQQQQYSQNTIQQAPRRHKYQNEPFVYFEQQLQPPTNKPLKQPKMLSYYSKNPYLSK